MLHDKASWESSGRGLERPTQLRNGPHLSSDSAAQCGGKKRINSRTGPSAQGGPILTISTVVGTWNSAVEGCASKASSDNFMPPCTKSPVVQFRYRVVLIGLLGVPDLAKKEATTTVRFALLTLHTMLSELIHRTKVRAFPNRP